MDGNDFQSLADQSFFWYQYILNRIMGKKKEQQKTLKDVHTFPIHKNKTLRANLDAYIRLLRSKHSHLSTKEYLALVHTYVTRYSKLNKGISQSMVIQTTSKIKICRECNKWAGSQKMVQCNLCDDSFHQFCAGQLKTSKNQWICSNCESVQKKINSRVQKQQDMLKIVVKCSKCQQKIKDKKTETTCMRCQKKYHKDCYGEGVVVCEKCDDEIHKKMIKTPPKQLDIRESFKIASEKLKKKRRSTCQQRKQYVKKFEESEEKNEKKNEKLSQQKISPNQETIPFGFKKNKFSGDSTNFTACFSSTKRFTNEFPQMTEQEIENYKKNLIYTISTKNMEYTQDLQPQNCSLFEDIEESLDFAVEHLNNSDLRMFNKYKKQPIGPFELRHTNEMGYDVIVAKDIPKGMIVCEYVGDVYTNRVVLQLNAEKPNDSIMQLKYGINADESLSIMPIKYTNIARFINGTRQGSEDKANVKSLRALALGRPVVILYTIKPVRKGESLLYDYNAGQSTKGIDTSQYCE